MKIKEKSNIPSLLMLVHHCCVEGGNLHGEEEGIVLGCHMEGGGVVVHHRCRTKGGGMRALCMPYLYTKPDN